MATKQEVKQQVKYFLSQLGSQNAHHEFEHLCKHVTKARICSNIVPATGPVSAYGDQGADFETFRTDSTNIFGNSAFVEMSTTKRTVFSCSIQIDRVEDKIKGDVSKATERELKPERVVYFTTQNVPVGLRHSLQDWAAKEKQVELEIFDLEAISDLLSDNDTYWIAVQYLHVPAELLPPPSDPKKKWYFDSKKTYIDEKKQLVLNFAEFMELKRATRTATHNTTFRPDLSVWIELLKKYDDPSVALRLRRLAQYEVAVASLRGFEDGATFFTFTKKVFDDQAQIDDTGDLENLQVLLFYLVGAWSKGVFQASRDEIKQFRSRVKREVDGFLNGKISENVRLSVLEISGSIDMFSEDLEFDQELSVTLETWNKILPHISANPLYPVERLADRITQLIEMSGGNPDLERMASQLDRHIADRSGKSSAAERARDRALIYYKQGNILQGIELLHEAKIQWFQNETIVGSLLTIMLIGMQGPVSKGSFLAG